MNAQMTRLSAGLAIVVLALAGGCGQSVHVEVKRLGTLAPSPTHPAALARAQVRFFALELLAYLDELKDVTEGRPESLPDRWVTEVRGIADALAETPAQVSPLTVYETREKLQALQGVTRQLGTVDEFLQPITGGDPDKEKTLRPKVSNLFDRIHTLEIQAMTAVVDARDALEYGGFQDTTVYKIDAASAAHQTLVSRDSGVLFSEVSIVLTGETAAMIVQQSPAHFVQKGVRADPTEVIRNSLIIVNKVLRVISRFIPELSAATFEVSAAPAPVGASAMPGEQAAPEAVATEGAVAALRALTSDPGIALILNKIKNGEGLDAQEADQLVGRLNAVLAMQGAGGGSD